MRLRKGQLDEDERRNWLRLIRSENVGPATFWKLLEYYGSATDALAAIPELAQQGGKTRKIKICSERDVDRELGQIRKWGAEVLSAADPTYPLSLKSISIPPPVLCARGDTQLLNRQLISIVGARNASASGRKLAQSLARDLGQAEFVIVSGLARGIDTAAHEGALSSGTIAVLAGGVDCHYPPQNKDLYNTINTSGLIVSEQPLGYVAQARDFPKRNRIVSGLALGVVIVEASLRSGSLITANFAADQGRDVFAVPGSPLDPRARGPNRLIRDGAILVENAEQVLQTLKAPRMLEAQEPPSLPASEIKQFNVANENSEDLSGARRKLIDLLGPTPTTVDELIRLGDVTPATVHRVLLELELAGRLERHHGGRISRI